MARAIVPLRNLHPRWHPVCDHCGCEVSYENGYRTITRETAAGSFEYKFCRECNSTLLSKRKSVMENASRRAMVRHAARYSPEFGAFVAKWFGVRDAAKLIKETRT